MADSLERIGVLKPLEEQDPDDLTSEDLREVVRRQKRRIELDRQDSMQSKRQKVRERTTTISATRSLTGTPEIVDLTEI